MSDPNSRRNPERHVEPQPEDATTPGERTKQGPEPDDMIIDIIHVQERKTERAVDAVVPMAPLSVACVRLGVHFSVLHSSTTWQQSVSYGRCIGIPVYTDLHRQGWWVQCKREATIADVGKESTIQDRHSTPTLAGWLSIVPRSVSDKRRASMSRPEHISPPEVRKRRCRCI